MLIRFTKIFLILLLLCSFAKAKCQNDLHEGEITLFNGKSIQGFVGYKLWERNPVKINFRENPDSKSITYGIKDLARFSVRNDSYVRAIVNEEISLTTTYDEKLNLVTDTVFLQTLISGPKSLFYLKNRDGKELFYILQGTTYELLVFKTFYQDIDRSDNQNGNLINQSTGTAKVVTANKKFIGQLSVYLNDCPSIQSQLTKTIYGKESLTNLFEFYYKSTNQQVHFQKKSEKTKGIFGLLAGPSVSKINFYDSSFHQDLVNLNFPSSTNITGGLFLELCFPGKKRDWSFESELMYTSYHVKQSYDKSNFNYTYAFGFTYLKLNNLIRYNFSTEKFRSYLNVGFSNGVAISKINNYDSYTSLNVYPTEKGLEKTRGYEQGILAGCGFIYKKIGMEIRIEKGDGITPPSFLQSNSSREYLLFRYVF